MDTQLKKSFFKRFWWIIIILVIFLIPVSFFGGNYLTGGALRIKKQFSAPTKSGFYNNSPTIVDDYIYIGTSINTSEEPQKDNYFYKMDLNLKPIWQYKLKDYLEVQGSAALDSQKNIYFVVTSRKKDKRSIQKNDLYSLTNSGTLRWTKEISMSSELFKSGPTTPAIGIDDTIYIGDSKFFAFKPDGNLVWSYPNDNKFFAGMRSSPIIDKMSNIYFIAPMADTTEESENYFVYKFTAAGNLLWQSQKLTNNQLKLSGQEKYGFSKYVSTSPAFSTNQTIIYAASSNTVTAINTQTGAFSWSFTPEGIYGDFEASPVVDDQDNVYIGTKANESSTLYAIRADGKGLLWENRIGGDLYGTPALGDGRILYQSSEYTGSTGTFHAIDMKTGKYLWNINISLGIKDFQKTSPSIHNGYAYIGTMSKDIFGSLLKIKIDSKEYLSDAAWPRFHGGNDNSGRLIKTNDVE